jgi:hypothetical protein
MARMSNPTPQPEPDAYYDPAIDGTYTPNGGGK